MTVELTHIRGNEKRTLRLCHPCAEQRIRKFEEGALETTAPSGGHEAEAEPESPPKKPAKQINVVVGHLSRSDAAGQAECGECGMTYKDFRKVGRLGCKGCYAAFSSQLERLFKRLHGAVRHEGKGPRPSSPEPGPSPGSGNEWQKLREALRKAVAEEAYEKAAAIRDRMARLEASEEAGTAGGDAGRPEP